MKLKLFATAALAAALSTSAFAADLPSLKAPPAPILPPPPLWTGFYVGVNAGGTFGSNSGLSSWAADNFDDGLPAAAGAAASLSASGANLGNFNNSGFLAGGQVGYNYQFNDRIVAGIEADIQGVAGSGANASFTGASADPLGSPTTMVTTAQFQGSLDYLGTVRGRIGFLITPTLLIYGTAGLAYGGVNFSSSYVTTDLAGVYGPGLGGGSYSDTRIGWTGGGGVEWMFLPNWSAKVEYLYYDLGSATVGSVVMGANTTTFATGYAYGAATRAGFAGNVVRAGLNYHFNWAAPAPILAKY